MKDKRASGESREKLPVTGTSSYMRFSVVAVSLLSYLRSEVTREYQLEEDEERYRAKRQKMYSFLTIPRELEKFMSYGFFHCLDSFLFVLTFLPIRFTMAAGAFVYRAPQAALRSV